MSENVKIHENSLGNIHMRELKCNEIQKFEPKHNSKDKEKINRNNILSHIIAISSKNTSQTIFSSLL
jgi:hypothetical protein